MESVLVIKDFITVNWTTLFPFITGISGAIVGVIGNQTFQRKFRKEDEYKKNLQLLNSFKGKLGVVIDSIDTALMINNSKGHNEPTELQKDRAIRNFKKHFSEFSVYKDNISKLLESEEHFLGKNNFLLIKDVNGILRQIHLYVYQISEHDDPDIAAITYNHNILLFNEINNYRSQLKEILHQLS